MNSQSVRRLGSQHSGLPANDDSAHSSTSSASGMNNSHRSSTKRSRKAKPKKKSTSSVISWVLSGALAFSLFQTFTYQPPSHLDGIDTEHGVHHPHQLLLESSKLSIPQQQQQQQQSNNMLQKYQPLDAPHVTLPHEELFTNNTRTLMQVLKEAGVVDTLTREELDAVPQLERVWNQLYSPRSPRSTGATNATTSASTGPLIYGLETCEAYRQMVPLNERYTAPAGMFNTGTNNLQTSLQKNIKDIRSYYQVPWGKHRMEARRLHHVAPGAEKFVHEKCLPIVIVRDPYHWMQSMCKSPYAAHWRHGPHRCPNLVPSKRDNEKWDNIVFDQKELHTKDATTRNDDEGDSVTPFQVKITFDKDDIEYFDSLIDLWNEWYRPYWKNKDGYPRIIVRFEDMLMHAPVVMDQIAKCVGVELGAKEYKYQTDSAKGHGSHTTFLKAIMKSADGEMRSKGLTLKDKIYAAQHLDTEMMEAFQYQTVVE